MMWWSWLKIWLLVRDVGGKGIKQRLNDVMTVKCLVSRIRKCTI